MAWLWTSGDWWGRLVQHRGLAVAPANLNLTEYKAMTFLGEGDLVGARAVLEAAPREVEPTALMAHLANYWDLVWILSDEQRELLLRLTPSAFDDDRGTWGFCLAQASALKGDAASVRAGWIEPAMRPMETMLSNRRRILVPFTGRF